MRLKDCFSPYIVIDGAKVALPKPLVRQLVSRSWAISIQQCGENKSSVSQLEAEVLSEFAAFQADDNPRLDFLTMQVRLLGVTADHGARSKSVGANSVSARCGECSCILSKDVPFSFLDWGLLCRFTPVSVAEWSKARFEEIPSHLLKWSDVIGEQAGLSSYDNHHNIVGHIQDLFKLLLSVVPPHGGRT